jgi:hypothetical protein
LADGQDLLKEKIRKITSAKKSIYLEKGIFHNGFRSEESVLVAVRHSRQSDGGERVVLDFSSKKIPRIYGYLSADSDTIFLDLFKVKTSLQSKKFSSSSHVDRMIISQVGGESLPVELHLRKKIKADFFYLENPARLVIDMGR